MCPDRLTKEQNATRMKMPIYFVKKCRNYDNFRISELRSIDETWVFLNECPSDASIISRGCAKTKLGMSS